MTVLGTRQSWPLILPPYLFSNISASRDLHGLGFISCTILNRVTSDRVSNNQRLAYSTYRASTDINCTTLAGSEREAHLSLSPFIILVLLPYHVYVRHSLKENSIPMTETPLSFLEGSNRGRQSFHCHWGYGHGRVCSPTPQGHGGAVRTPDHGSGCFNV